MKKVMPWIWKSLILVAAAAVMGSDSDCDIDIDDGRIRIDSDDDDDFFEDLFDKPIVSWQETASSLMLG